MIIFTYAEEGLLAINKIEYSLLNKKSWGNRNKNIVNKILK